MRSDEVPEWTPDDLERHRRYADVVNVVVRRELPYSTEGPFEALVGEIHVGGEVPLEEFAAEFGGELMRRGADTYVLDTRRTRVEIGASGAAATAVITIFTSGAAGVLLHELWDYAKAKLGGDPMRDFALQLRSAPEYAADRLVGVVATAIDARRAEIRTVEIALDGEAVRGLFEVSTGERYRVTVADELFEIIRDGEAQAPVDESGDADA
ncbi:MAG: hypothetical protein WD249_07480 [Gaiellaceae bacterium]